MLIDTQNHVNYVGRNVHEVVADMDRHGIDVTWILTWYLAKIDDVKGYHVNTTPTALRADGTHAAMPLRDVIAARNLYPKRFVAGYCPCPWEGDAAALFESAYRIHGVRVCGEWSYRLPLDDPRAVRLFHAVGRLKCPVVLHMDAPWLPPSGGSEAYQKIWYAGSWFNLERALQLCPDTVFIGHCPAFWREISGDADDAKEAYPQGPVTPGGRLFRLFDTYPNLWADLSAGSGLRSLQRDLAVARDLLIRYQDRLLFARDCFSGEHMVFLKSLNLPREAEQKIFAGNALRLVPDTPR